MCKGDLDGTHFKNGSQVGGDQIIEKLGRGTPTDLFEPRIPLNGLMVLE